MSDQQGAIINKVANSALITLDLEEYYPKGIRVVYDIKQHLFQEMILKEKDFRAFVKSHDWTQYSGQYVALTCSADAIVPTWAYMLLVTHLQPYAAMVIFGDLDMLEAALFKDALHKLDLEGFRDAKVVIKGCSKYPVPVFAYAEITRLLRPYAASIMYGEPCSTVPLYKKPKA